jgi:hypothetical protein
MYSIKGTGSHERTAFSMSGWAILPIAMFLAMFPIERVEAQADGMRQGRPADTFASGETTQFLVAGGQGADYSVGKVNPVLSNDSTRVALKGELECGPGDLCNSGSEFVFAVVLDKPLFVFDFSLMVGGKEVAVLTYDTESAIATIEAIFADAGYFDSISQNVFAFQTNQPLNICPSDDPVVIEISFVAGFIDLESKEGFVAVPQDSVVGLFSTVEAIENGSEDPCHFVAVVDLPRGAIPAASTWGILILVLLLLVAGKVQFGRSRVVSLAA